MATDPVRRIQQRDYQTDIDLHVIDPLTRLANLPASLDAPYLTVSLDWTPSFDDPGRMPAEELRASERRNRSTQSTSRRPARTWFEQEARNLLAGLDQRSAQYAQLEADIARVNRFLDSELDPAASGVYIVSCDAHGIFEPLALGVPVENAVETGPMPAVEILAHVAEDYATYGILMCSQQEAELSFVTQGARDRGVYLDSNLYPRRHRQGGPSERRFRARADERQSAFARAVSNEVSKALRETKVEVLVLVGSEVFANTLMNEFSPQVKELVAGIIPMHLQGDSSIGTLVEATAPLAMEAERRREAKAVATLQEQLGGGLAVAGAIDVLRALRAHQVSKLIMNEDFTASGWADFGFPLRGVGPVPDEHPAGGDVKHIVSVDLQEEFVRLALQSGGAIEFVHTEVPVEIDPDKPLPQATGELPRTDAAVALDRIGGVGALLRFAI